MGYTGEVNPSPHIRIRLMMFLALMAGVLFFGAERPTVARAATTLETVISECKNRTGFSDATCATLVKKYMNVERCKEYTNYSDEECAEKIEEIKKDPEFSSGAVNSSPARATKPVPGTLSRAPFRGSQGTGIAAVIRSRKEKDLIALWERTQAVTSQLKAEGVEVQAIEAVFPEFERRAETLLSAYDRYQTIYDSTAKDSVETRQALRREARNMVVQAIRDLIDHYRTNILVPLRAAHEKTL